MSSLPADRYSTTHAKHTGCRSERTSYTTIGVWWSFNVPLGPWKRCMTWSYEHA